MFINKIGIELYLIIQKACIQKCLLMGLDLYKGKLLGVLLTMILRIMISIYNFWIRIYLISVRI